MNIYRDEVGRFLRLKLEDEDGDSNNNKGGEGKGGTTTDRTISRPSNAVYPPLPRNDGRITTGGIGGSGRDE